MNDKLVELMARKLTGGLSPEAEKQLEALLASDEALREEAALLEECWRVSGLYAPPEFEVDGDAAWARLQQRLQAQPEVKPLWRRWLAVASVALLLVAAYFFFMPGEGAQMLTAAAHSGVLLQPLPDGSQVWLSEGSTLSYPAAFGNRREVYLSGEAYFEVAKDPAHPFVVQGHYGHVQVLGTRFDYRSRPGSGEKLLVAEGKVAYEVKGVEKRLVLVKEEAAAYDPEKGSLQKANYHPNAFYWQTGRLVFRGTPLREVLDELESLFEVRFDRREIEHLLSCRQTLSFNDHPGLEDVLKALQAHLGWKMWRDDKGIWHLSGGKCE